MNNRLRNGLIIALGISVALNLLLVGVGIGHTFHQPPPMMRMNPMLGLSHFTHDLSDERRKELAQTLRAFRDASRPAIGEMRELQHQLREEIRREPFDPVRLKRALAALHAHMQASQSTSTDSFVQLMQALTADERAALDQHMRQSRRQPPRDRPPRINGPHQGSPHPSDDGPDTPDQQESQPLDAPLPVAPPGD